MSANVSGSVLFLDYESENFPAAVLQNGQRRLDVSWDEILWAAITVGRPDIFRVFGYGTASVYEVIFRWSMVRMALQQRGQRGYKLVRTDLFKQMDPTEKGAVNYFLGLLICKLFASKLLDAPWTLHLDVFRPMLNPRMIGGRSRPDMVAQSASTTQWHAFECKGRASVPGDAEKQKAKAQAQRLVSVNGTPCTLHVGSITFFRNDAVELYWRDPEPGGSDPIQLPNPDFAWRNYYEPFTEVIRARRDVTAHPLDTSAPVPIEEADLTVQIHPKIAPILLASEWQTARDVARVSREEFARGGFRPDGLLVRAGPTWFERLEAVEFG
jgi:hypothetical protein